MSCISRARRALPVVSAIVMAGCSAAQAQTSSSPSYYGYGNRPQGQSSSTCFSPYGGACTGQGAGQRYAGYSGAYGRRLGSGPSGTQPSSGGYSGYGSKYSSSGVLGGSNTAQYDDILLQSAISRQQQQQYDPPPSQYQGLTWYGNYGGCKVRWRWDPEYHKYLRRGGCR